MEGEKIRYTGRSDRSDYADEASKAAALEMTREEKCVDTREVVRYVDNARQNAARATCLNPNYALAWWARAVSEYFLVIVPCIMGSEDTHACLRGDLAVIKTF